MIELIIARYKENINWTANINPKFKCNVYNKFDTENNYLPNVGRESHTYLYHIINNYHNLSDYCVFLQGNPIFHDKSIVDRINNLDPDNTSFPLFFGYSRLEYPQSVCCSSHVNGLPMYYFLDLLFGIKCETTRTEIRFHPGAQFVVDKETILFRPKSFYQFLIKFLSTEINPIEGFIMERLWPYIFNKNIPLSKKLELFLD
jgi:hypothetical protein